MMDSGISPPTDRPATYPPMPPLPQPGWTTTTEAPLTPPPPETGEPEPKKEGFWSRIMRRKR
jgi:hypothetical protein